MSWPDFILDGCQIRPKAPVILETYAVKTVLRRASDAPSPDERAFLMTQRVAVRREVTVHRLRLSYLEWGEQHGSRPSLVILHGLLAAAETFDRVVDGLPEDQHVIALDMPANGHSENDPKIDCSTASLAGFVLEFCERIALKRPVIAGHSHGGLLAMRLAASHPDKVRGLVLLAPAHPYDGYREAMVQFYLRPLGRNAARIIFPRIPAWLYLFFFRQMPGTRDHFDHDVMAPYLHSLRMPGTVPYTLRVLETWHDDMEVLRGDLERCPLQIPALVLWGLRDLVVPFSSAPPLLQNFTNAEVVEMPAAGHLANEEMPETVAAAMRGWLARSFS